MVKKVVLLAAIVFIVATALSMRLEAMSDGYTTLGLPLTFLKYTGGKCAGCIQYFKWGALALDLIIALTVAFGCLKVWNLVTAKRK